MTTDSKPQPRVPKVILVGDSIRLSYAPLVAEKLASEATIVSPAANGGDSSNVLKNVQKWIISEQPEIVHFNCGIHDTKYFEASGKFQISPQQYEQNLRAIVERIRGETKATILFATSTPILDERAAATRQGRDYVLTNAAITQYNEIAVRVMAELKVPVNDLNARLSMPKPPAEPDQMIGADGVHLTDAGKVILADAVAELIASHLKTTSIDRDQ
ncbi:MAG: SGNH/GDSL hydrolase family protein [Planctomycetaceae bacterium]|nr:SGNH/GDSL hydrolase family protein [Planctomycetaceae bacterium]